MDFSLFSPFCFLQWFFLWKSQVFNIILKVFPFPNFVVLLLLQIQWIITILGPGLLLAFFLWIFWQVYGYPEGVLHVAGQLGLVEQVCWVAEDAPHVVGQLGQDEQVCCCPVVVLHVGGQLGQEEQVCWVVVGQLGQAEQACCCPGVVLDVVGQLGQAGQVCSWSIGWSIEFCLCACTCSLLQISD